MFYRFATSEYNSNFVAPNAFSYDEGAWKGAAPPQLLQNTVRLFSHLLSFEQFLAPQVRAIIAYLLKPIFSDSTFSSGRFDIWMQLV